MEEFGSYNWYSGLQDPFYQNIVKAINHADLFNLGRLAIAVPNMIVAHGMDGWDRRPFPRNEIDINNNVEYAEPEPPKELKCVQGSFNWYRCRSGHLVTYLSKAIMHADEDMLSSIENAFPQMIAAFGMGDWNIPPSGFRSSSYNSCRSG